MNQGLKNNNISFKSKFDFVYLEKYKKILNELNPKCVETDDIGEIFNGGSLCTNSIASCTAYTFTNKIKKNAIIEHVNKYSFCVAEAINDFINKGKTFIFGGDLSSEWVFFQKDSKKIADAKMPITVFWGQDMGSTSFAYNADNDTCYVYKKMMPHWDQRQSPKSIEELKSSYHIINVANGDEVYINGKFVSPELINKNNDEFKYCSSC